MPSNAIGTNQQIWVDYNFPLGYILFPFGLVAALWGCIIFGVVGPYMMLFTDKGTGLSRSKEFMFIAIFVFGTLFSAQRFIGACQVMFIEARRLFIVRKLIRLLDDKGNRGEDRFTVRDRFLKKADFIGADIVSIEPYFVQTKWYGKKIMSLLADANYKVTLKGGRVFYLSGKMDKVDELKDVLKGYTNIAV